ncbi:MAG TPA: endonuclease/exonuclease/phosphatase family protein [Candidatus Saccharimonadia bacterium]|nr:endonuclease/exonuclease/phosphatase family protein [Candidatus Saccharimonadia bacterium]
MKLLQINVWQGRLLRPLLDLVKHESPDIICAQEIYTYPEPIAPTSPWNYFRTVERIAELGGYQYVHFALSTTFTMADHPLGYGNAILSRYPLHDASVHYTGGPGPLTQNHLAAYDSNATRNFQHVVVDAGSTNINLINHHGHWVNQPLGDDASAHRLQLVAKFVAGLTGPVIVTGDFNLSPQSPAMKQFLETTGLTDQVTTAGTITTSLSAAHYLSTPIVCDYILTNPELTVSSLHASDRLVSDHRAIIAEIDA